MKGLRNDDAVMRRGRFLRTWRADVIFVVIIVIVASFIGKVGRTLVLVRTRIILISSQELVDISRRILVEFLVLAEDDDRDVNGAEDG